MNFTERGLSWEANIVSACSNIPCISRNSEIHYCLHKSGLLVWLTKCTTSHPVSLRYVLISSSHLHLGLPTGIACSFYFRQRHCIELGFSPLSVTCHAPVMKPYSIMLIVLVKNFQALRSSAIPLTSFHDLLVFLISSSIVLRHVLFGLPFPSISLRIPI